MREFKVTEKDVNSTIVAEQYTKLGYKTTICVLVLNSGFEVVGSSAPVDPAIYDFETGKKFAREKAVEKVWEYLGSIVSYEKAIHDAQQDEKRRHEEALKAEAEAFAKTKVDEMANESHEVPPPPHMEIIKPDVVEVLDTKA